MQDRRRATTAHYHPVSPQARCHVSVPREFRVALDWRGNRINVVRGCTRLLPLLALLLQPLLLRLLLWLLLPLVMLVLVVLRLLLLVLAVVLVLVLLLVFLLLLLLLLLLLMLMMMALMLPALVPLPRPRRLAGEVLQLPLDAVGVARQRLHERLVHPQCHRPQMQRRRGHHQPVAAAVGCALHRIPDQRAVARRRHAAAAVAVATAASNTSGG